VVVVAAQPAALTQDQRQVQAAQVTPVPYQEPAQCIRAVVVVVAVLEASITQPQLLVGLAAEHLVAKAAQVLVHQPIPAVVVVVVVVALAQAPEAQVDRVW
jgi:hypothetical protein